MQSMIDEQPKINFFIGPGVDVNGNEISILEVKFKDTSFVFTKESFKAAMDFAVKEGFCFIQTEFKGNHGS